jgi:hypothetical protein
MMVALGSAKRGVQGAISTLRGRCEQPGVERLRTLKKAYDEGLLSQDEYEQKRRQVVGQM